MAVNDVFGFNFPFLGENFVLPPQAGARIIKNDLKQLLLTSLEERVMRPTNGTIIRKTVFEMLDSITVSDLRDNIKHAINAFEPRVTFREIKVIGRADEGLVEIHVFVSLKRDPSQILIVDVAFTTQVPSITTRPTAQIGAS